MFPSTSTKTHVSYNERDSVVEWYSTLFSIYGISKDSKSISQEQQYSPMKILGNDIIITPPGSETYNAIRIFNFTTYMENKEKPYMYVKCKGTGTTADQLNLTVDIVIDLSNARQMRYGSYYRYELTASTINMYTKATVNETGDQYEQAGSYTFDTCDIAFIIDTRTDTITPLYFDLVFTSTWGEYAAEITATSDGMTTLRNSYRTTKNTFLKMNESSTITKIIAFSDGGIPYETYPIPISTLKGSRDSFMLQLLDYKGDVINPISDVYNTLFAIEYFIQPQRGFS